MTTFKIVIQKIWVCIFVVNSCAGAYAGSQPSPILQELFSGQRSMYYSKAEVTDYRLALSAWKKINNNWLVDREEILSGFLEKRTLELSESYHLDEVEKAVYQYFDEKNIKELFRCEGLDCGSSNAWANNYFQVKQLYGLDDTQKYRVGVVYVDGKQVFFSSYIVQRGNKRIYCQLEALSLASGGVTKTVVPSSESILHTLEKNNFFRLPISDSSVKAASVEEQHVLAIAEMLKTKPVLRVFVVGQNFEDTTLEKQIKRSQESAEIIAGRLITLGVSRAQVVPKGVGSLAPAPDNRSGFYLILNNSR